MKKLLLALVVLGIFTGVSIAAETTPVTTNAAADTAAPDQGVKKPKHHKKGKKHNKAKKEAAADKAADTTVNATK